MSQNEYIVHNDTDMKQVVQRLLSNIYSAGTNSWVLALSGDLGAGKTTLVKALARELGILESVTSPTFIIQKSYTVTGHKCIKSLVHIDAYRLESGADTEVLSLSKTIAMGGNLVVIEWAENIKEALPHNTIKVELKYVDDPTRRVVVLG